MGALDHLRRIARRLPLGEHPPGHDELRDADATTRLLAETASADGPIRWAGWIYAGRGRGPSEGLDHAAAAITTTSVCWVPVRRDLPTERIPHADVDRVMVNRRDRRVLLVRNADGLEADDLPVLFSFDCDLAAEIDAARR